jgi:hypothetical protein
VKLQRREREFNTGFGARARACFSSASIGLTLCGCVDLPNGPAERALYLDLRKIVDTNEDGGWTVDWLRLQANAEPALRSVCQVERGTRDELDVWLADQIALAGGPAKRAYLAHGRDLGAVSHSLSLERTRALLQYASSRAAEDCPFWLAPNSVFAGDQGDAAHWVILGETQAFATFTVPGNIPALGGGGRLFLGHGIGSRFTLAAGADVAASGTFVPSGGRSGVDAYLTLATPALLRLTRFSRMFDVELAPVVRLSQGQSGWPPGARIQVGAGFSSVRISPFMPYFMVYAGYEIHPTDTKTGIDQTIQIGTRIAVDGAL